MWNDRLEAYAAEMRTRAAKIRETEIKIAKVKKALTTKVRTRKVTTPRIGTPEISEPRAQRASPKNTKTRMAAHFRLKAAAYARQVEQESTRVIEEHELLTGDQSDGIGPGIGRKSRGKIFVGSYPDCRHCSSDAVIRAGTGTGNQRYRCLRCYRTFAEAPIKTVDYRAVWKLMCYRCGSLDTINCGPSPKTGRWGYCNVCLKKFTQGGRREVEKYHLLLQQRVKSLILPGDIAEELLQQAYTGVLEGQGYCWTIGLDIAKAKKAARSHTWLGTDSCAFKLAQSQTITIS